MIDKIYLWKHERVSRSHYKNKNSAINAVTRRNPFSFGILKFINEKYLIKYIEAKLRYANTRKCKERASKGVYFSQDAIKFKKELLELVERETITLTEYICDNSCIIFLTNDFKYIALYTTKPNNLIEIQYKEKCIKAPNARSYKDNSDT